MSFKLSGLNGLPYLGVQATTPPQLLYVGRAPTVNDFRNINVGTLWLYVGQPSNNPIKLYMAATVIPGDAEWILLYPTSGSGAQEFVTDSGRIATPSSGVIRDLGDGNVIQTDAPGSGNTITTTLLNGGDGQVIIGGGAQPLWANVTSNAGIGLSVTIVPGANTLDLSVPEVKSTDGSIIVTYAGSSPTTPGTINLSVTDSGGGLVAGEALFSAYLSKDLQNVTPQLAGVNVYYVPVVCDIEFYDTYSLYNTGTGTFIAPIAGKYTFNFMTTNGSPYSSSIGVPANNYTSTVQVIVINDVIQYYVGGINVGATQFLFYNDWVPNLASSSATTINLNQSDNVTFWLYYSAVSGAFYPNNSCWISGVRTGPSYLTFVQCNFTGK